MFGDLATVVTLAVVSGLGFASVRVVQPGQAYVVELLGRYRRTLGPGGHLLVPFLERVHAKVALGEQVVRVQAEPAITSDDLVLCASTTVYFRVRDPARLSYTVGDLAAVMRMLTTTMLRNIAGSITLDQARTGGTELASRLTEASREKGQQLGTTSSEPRSRRCGRVPRHGCP